MMWLVRTDYDKDTVGVKLTFLDEESQQLVSTQETDGHKPFFILQPAEGTVPMARADPWSYAAFVFHSHIDGLRNAFVTALYNPVTEQKETFIQVITKTPNHVKYINDDMAADKLPIADWVYANHIEYEIRYLIDRGLHPGMAYRITGEMPIQEPTFLDAKAVDLMKQRGYPDWLVQKLLPLFSTRIPHIRRVALDIECRTKLSVHEPHIARDPVTSVAFCFEDGTGYVFALSADARGMKPQYYKPLEELAAKGVKLEFFDTEYDLLARTFQVLGDPTIPCIITFNGDTFDIPYLYRRAERLGFELAHVPILAFRLRRPQMTTHHKTDIVDVRRKLHLDVRQFLKQPFVKNSTFQNKYKQNSLEVISEALLGKRKHVLETPVDVVSPQELAYYNFIDAQLTMELTQIRNEVVIKLIFFLMRLGRHDFNEASRRGISSSIGKLITSIHIEREWLIPNRAMLDRVGKAATVGLSKGKLKGAIIVPPEQGIHASAKVIDFASLYPTLMKERNLSYETMNCSHAQCKRNTVPDTPHWVCEQRRGILSLIVGFIRDLRLLFWKPLKKVDKEAEIVEQGLKVLGNAYYGCIAARFSPFYCAPTAESVTAFGRDAITKAITRTNQIGAAVVYGDTDSVFIANASDSLADDLKKWADDQLHLDLDMDKTYRLLILYEKKNYLGIKLDGEIDVVGLTGKKRTSPPIIRRGFNAVKEYIRDASANGFTQDSLTKGILDIVKTWYEVIGQRGGTVADYAVMVGLSRSISEYRAKTPPPHVRAAIESARLTSLGEKVTMAPSVLFPPGSDIEYIKGVKDVDGKGKRFRPIPLEFAKLEEVDTAVYQKDLLRVMSQLLGAIGVSEEMALNYCKGMPWLGLK